MNRLKRLGIHLPLLFLFIIASSAIRTVALFTQFNPATGYYNGKLLTIISDGIIIGGIAILLSFIFFSQKIDVVANFKGPLTFIPAGMVCAALIFLSFEMFVKYANQKNIPSNSSPAISAQIILPILIALLAIACIANFLLTVMFAKPENETRAFFGILTVIFLAIYASYLYFDTKLPLNSPNKAFDQLAFLFTAIFFLYETRISLGREMWRAYCAFGFVAALTTAYSSIPTLIYYLASGVMVSDSVAGSVLCFTLFVYITLRVFSVNYLLNKKKSDEVLAIIELAKARTEEMALPDSSRNYNKDEQFNTLGENYQFDLHLTNTHEQPDNSSDDTQPKG